MFKSQYKGRTRVQTKIDPDIPAMTEQAHRDSCDVNKIVKRLAQSGMQDPGWTEQNYGEFDPVEFQDAMNTLARGQTAYEELPGNIRQKFQTPMEYMDFMTNPENQQKIIDLGLATKIENQNPGINIDTTQLRSALRDAINTNPDANTEEK